VPLFSSWNSVIQSIRQLVRTTEMFVHQQSATTFHRTDTVCWEINEKWWVHLGIRGWTPSVHEFIHAGAMEQCSSYGELIKILSDLRCIALVLERIVSDRYYQIACQGRPLEKPARLL